MDPLRLRRPAPDEIEDRRAVYQSDFERHVLGNCASDEEERRAARGLLAWVIGGASTTVIVGLFLILAACTTPAPVLDTSSRLAPEASRRPMPRPQVRP
jgi:hypothetical protein